MPFPHAFGAFLALACLSGQASAACRGIAPGSSYGLPLDATLACAQGGCTVTLGGALIGSVQLRGLATLCTGTQKQVEAALPPSCAQAYRSSTFTLSQDLSPMERSDLVLDVVAPVQARGPSPDACLPKYVEKRGDVWQYAWSGQAGNASFRAFEEDETPAGRGNVAHGRPPKALFATTGRVLVNGGGPATPPVDIRSVLSGRPPTAAPLLPAPPFAADPGPSPPAPSVPAPADTEPTVKRF